MRKTPALMDFELEPLVMLFPHSSLCYQGKQLPALLEIELEPFKQLPRKSSTKLGCIKNNTKYFVPQNNLSLGGQAKTSYHLPIAELNENGYKDVPVVGGSPGHRMRLKLERL